MLDEIPLNRLFEDAAARRLWLLREALRVAPFDRAIELARTAEAFVTAENIAHIDGRATSSAQDFSEKGQLGGSTFATLPTKRSGVALAGEERGRLLDRLAQGARNAELALEFGISPKQVQGFRMGCAREIAKRRATLADRGGQSAERHQHPTATASVDEIVRYLRQQDDVVVSQEDGWYLVNGRFRMSVTELMARANRMRSRQQKPAFQIPAGRVQLDSSSAQNRHPLFWETASSQRGPSGFRQPADTDTDSA
jgi:hypothetical protein